MSPFSHLLHELRMRHGIRQVELADLIGYEQSYISALEIGVKGPPTANFVERLIDVLKLPEAEQARLWAATEASQRKFVIDDDVSQEVYWMLRDLQQQLPKLSEIQIRMIRDVLRVRDPLELQPEEPARRLKRRSREEAKM